MNLNNNEDVSSPAKALNLNNNEDVSSPAKALNSNNNEDVSSLAKALNRFNSQDNTNNKINEQITQYLNKTSPVNSSTNPSPQQGSAQAKADSNESPKIFDVRPNLVEANVSKSQDNSTSINNNIINNLNADEAIIQVNTSSDNSFSNNQGTDTFKEPNINPINIKQNTEPEVNFTNTLSQISGSTKPFEALGNDIADNIIQRARLFMEGGKSEIKLQLNPPELGSLKLEFAVEDDNLEAKITVERSTVKDIIERDIPRLRALISNADIDVGKLDVFLQEKEDGRWSFMNKDLQSDSDSKKTQDSSSQEKEYFEDDVDKESMVYDADSNKINYLV
ncbi:MAG: flagellar hook-length control protein [Candidatus Scalindua rubra]|uniref:Flagellar hook-length control protein n=1 Tax=Candidatus Scalindua rubra TaxID=1872076 RepID=A0A1E3X482_9BACT|nr:MAG: flagellar hook-length control protein [Candidatus Scalindua rubra]